eukprot:jgi/Mesvir1/13845/Mv15991-RA.1
MGVTSTLGRVFIASIFILTAYYKYETFGSDGGPMAGFTVKKFAKFVEKLPFEIPFPLPEGKQLVMAGAILEGLGGLLLLLDVYLGAYLLMLFLSVATVVFHDFYNEPADSMAFQNEFIHFFKFIKPHHPPYEPASPATTDSEDSDDDDEVASVDAEAGPEVPPQQPQGVPGGYVPPPPVSG